MKNLIVACVVLVIGTAFAFSKDKVPPAKVEKKTVVVVPVVKVVESKVEDFHMLNKGFRRITGNLHGEDLGFTAVEVLNAAEDYYRTRENQFERDPVVDGYLNEIAFHMAMARFRARAQGKRTSYTIIWDKTTGEWTGKYVPSVEDLR